jgi:hypothetical protein
MLRSRLFEYRNPLLLAAMSFLVLGVLLVGHSFSQSLNSTAITTPPIVWNPSSLNVVIAAGATTTINASFVASENLNDVELRVVPELQPFIHVTPSTPITVAVGHPVPIQVTISVPAIMLPQNISGTIQVRMTEGNGKNVPRPLPVDLNIIWATYSDAQLGVRVFRCTDRIC